MGTEASQLSLDLLKIVFYSILMPKRNLVIIILKQRYCVALGQASQNLTGLAFSFDFRAPGSFVGF